MDIPLQNKTGISRISNQLLNFPNETAKSDIISFAIEKCVQPRPIQKPVSMA
jgi:hypothetical protein